MNDVMILEPTPEQIVVIKETICKGATDEEMRLFFFDCSRNGVHPLDRLIHFTKRKAKNQDGTWGSRYTPITSIDFFRMRAEASGEYGGQDDAVFTGEFGKPDFKASVTVYRFLNNQRVPITASARWTEYNPEGEFSLWRKMPYLMLAKCAEALALRKAFPKQLHGLYSHEEMAQADNKKGPTTPVLQGVDTKAHLKKLAELPEAVEEERTVWAPNVVEPPEAQPEIEFIEPTPSEVAMEAYHTELEGIPATDVATAEKIFGRATMDTNLEKVHFTRLEAYFYKRWPKRKAKAS